MHVTLISDTHNQHWLIDPDVEGMSGDVIIHAGDFSSSGTVTEFHDFAKWFGSLDYEHKIFIAGNHDWCFYKSETRGDVIRSAQFEYGLTYLEDSSCRVGDLNIYGYPWTPEFKSWAFNVPRNSQISRTIPKAIPKNTNILITHGPMYGVNDINTRGNHVGCPELSNTLLDGSYNNLIHVCGHIHEGYGVKELSHDIISYNASLLNHRYDMVHKPIHIIL